MENEKYIALIISDLNGQITENDAQELNSWRSSLPENEALYQETKAIWKQTGNYKSDIKVDSNKAWDKINAELKLEPKKISMFSRYKKIAAAVVILFATGFLMKTVLNDNGSISVMTASNETKEINLPDGSSIVLNENSTISYAKNFDLREVTLDGEAFFDVTKKDGKTFKVLSNNTETLVLGTSFNIDAKDDKVELALYTGKVKFTANNESKTLAPGEIVTYNLKENSLVKEQTNIENEIAWKTKILRFSNTDIKDVVSDIEKTYKIKISIKEDVSECKFSGKFKNATISEVLDAISFSFNTQYAFENDTYIFESLNCEE